MFSVTGKANFLTVRSKCMKIHAGTGFSGVSDARDAGREAAALAVAALSGEQPALVMVFTAPKYDLSALLAGVRAVTGDAPLIGGTSSGEIINGQYKGFGAGVAVLALTAGPYRFGLASAAHVKDNLDEAGQKIARESRTQAGDSPHAALIIFADSLLGDLQKVFQGAYRITGPRVAIIGGATGDEQKFIRTFVFHDDQVLEEGVAAVWVASDKPLEVVTRHGWEPIGVPLLVTRAEGIEIKELGGRPAADVYEEQLGLHPGDLLPENFWGTSVHHPFGLIQSDGTTVIRMARAKTPDGALRIQGCVPPTGSAVQVMTGTQESLLGIVNDVAGSALKNHADAGILLAFSCAARTLIFGSNTPEEARRLQEEAGDIPTFGFYCCGEFARTSGVLGTHNATLTAIAL
jgi:hypothetical protein